MVTYFIALGGNVGDREANLERALGLVAERIGQIDRRSSWHETAPLNPPDAPDLVQPDYLNGVVAVRTALQPSVVLSELLEIERILGRARTAGERWRPRTVDLDIIAAGDLVVELPTLRIPHPEMHHREFVLAPMSEIAPDWKHPVLEQTAAEMLTALRTERRSQDSRR